MLTRSDRHSSIASAGREGGPGPTRGALIMISPGRLTIDRLIREGGRVRRARVLAGRNPTLLSQLASLSASGGGTERRFFGSLLQEPGRRPGGGWLHQAFAAKGPNHLLSATHGSTPGRGLCVHRLCARANGRVASEGDCGRRSRLVRQPAAAPIRQEFEAQKSGWVRNRSQPCLHGMPSQAAAD